MELQGKRLPLQVSGKNLVGRFTLERDTSYELGCSGAFGFESNPGVVYQAKTIPDAPPECQLRREGAPENAAVGADD